MPDSQNPVPQQPEQVLNSAYVTPVEAMPVKPSETPKDHKAEEKASKGKPSPLRKILKIGGGILLALLVFLALIAVLMLTSLDVQIFKLSFDGFVRDQDQNPVVGATVSLGELVTQTNENGVFSFEGLGLETYDLNITAQNFQEYTEQITLERSFLNYHSFRVFDIQSSAKGNVSGSVTGNLEGYKYLDDRIYIDGEEYRLENDGTFQLQDIQVGSRSFEFKSTYYKDLQHEVNVTAGENSLAEIELTPAGDVLGTVVSWIREDLVLDLKITVEGVADENITIDSDGNFLVRDLEVDKEFILRTEKEGYETRDYTFTVTQGPNEILDFKVVEAGYIPYLKELDNDFYLYAANFDGLNETLLAGEDSEPFAEYIVDDELVFFGSTRDNYSNSGFPGKPLAPYVASVKNPNYQKVPFNFERLGRTIPAFGSGQMINIAKGDTSDERLLEVFNLETGNPTEIIRYSEEDVVFGDTTMSEDGKVLFYYVQDPAEITNGLYRATLEDSNATKLFDRKNLQIYSVNHDGNRILYTQTNESTGLTDLMLYTVSTQQDVKLRESVKGKQYHFVWGSSNLVLFHENRDGVNNVFMMNLDDNADTKLTNFIVSNLEGVEAVYQQGKYVFYQTNRGLYVLDYTKPNHGRLITRDFARYTGYDF